jgi:hypothetical protein
MTIQHFLEELGARIIVDDEMNENAEDEQFRVLCEHLNARRRLKLYRQLYALGCRIDGASRV